MAVLTKHPVAPPPAAPARERSGHLLLRMWCVIVLVQAFAAVAVMHVFGPVGTGAIAVGSTLLSAVAWVIARPYADPRRLPWFVLAYVVWVAASAFWSASPSEAGLAASTLALTTGQALFIACVLTWKEIVAAIAAALKWMIALALLAEFVFFPGQAFFGDTRLLGAIALFGLVVFAIRLVARAAQRVMLAVWALLALVLFVRESSAVGWLSAVAVAVVLATVLLMRTVRRPGGRTRYYALFAVVGIASALGVWLGRDALFTALEPAQNIWADTHARTGLVGDILVVGVAISFVWRSWFFAIDRPRWDLRADRPYSPLTLLPTLTGALLLVHALAGSGATLLWGWMLIVLLGVKLTQAPLVGVGPAEQSVAMEQGDRVGLLAEETSPRGAERVVPR